MVGRPAGGRPGLAQGVEELHVAVAALETVLAKSFPHDVGAVRLDAEGRLIIPPLTAEDVPAEARALKEWCRSCWPIRFMRPGRS